MSIKRILKFPLRPGEMPTDIKCNFVRLLDIQIQRSVVTAWVVTDSNAPEITIQIIPFGTGWEIPSDILEALEYVKTVQDDYGFVWHYHIKKG